MGSELFRQVNERHCDHYYKSRESTWPRRVLTSSSLNHTTMATQDPISASMALVTFAPDMSLSTGSTYLDSPKGGVIID